MPCRQDNTTEREYVIHEGPKAPPVDCLAVATTGQDLWCPADRTTPLRESMSYMRAQGSTSRLPCRGHYESGSLVPCRQDTTEREYVIHESPKAPPVDCLAVATTGQDLWCRADRTTPLRESMSYMRAPRLHQSTALPWPLRVRISGALQTGQHH